MHDLIYTNLHAINFPSEDEQLSTVTLNITARSETSVGSTAQDAEPEIGMNEFLYTSLHAYC